jgi:formyltetrahydrofolate-dependent phosphoribosylglycinamide formyltransferase
MFKKLQQKWKVDGKAFALIMCTFAVTGTLTAWISRQITFWLGVDKYTWAWWVLKIGVLVFGYQVIILIVGFCFGQFRFFWNYEKKILRRLGFFKASAQKTPVRVAIFASGSGSNAREIITYFTKNTSISIALVVSNKPEAPVREVAATHGIPFRALPGSAFATGESCIALLREYQIQYIVLAGFLLKIPSALLAAFPNRILNLHPALLPTYGGAGMYGRHVHEAVLAAGEKESGITIHLVDEWYDHGKPLLQVRCAVAPGDTAQTLAQRVQVLEHRHFAPTIEKWILAGQQV